MFDRELARVVPQMLWRLCEPALNQRANQLFYRISQI